MTEKALHYNFVFFFARDAFWPSVIGKEVYECEQVHVYKETFDGPRWMQKLFHYHWAYRVNRFLDLPFKSIWFRKMYKQSFPQKMPLCFVYLGGNNIFRDGGFTRYVRERDPRNRQVLMHEDLISKKCSYDYSLVRSKVDLATTYDRDEAEKYGISFFEENTYSKLIELPEHTEFESDVYFLGAAKDRLEMIMDMYRVLHEQGLKCRFVLTGVEESRQIAAEGIEYSAGISYEENLRNVIKTKCILEIVQGGSMSNTVRMREALAYQRRLLTNCLVTPRDSFHDGQLQVFQSPGEIDFDFFKPAFVQSDFAPKVDLNPMRRLYFIQEQIEGKADE